MAEESCNLFFIDHRPEMKLISFNLKDLKENPAASSAPDLDSQEFYAFEEKYTSGKMPR